MHKKRGSWVGSLVKKDAAAMERKARKKAGKQERKQEKKVRKLQKKEAKAEAKGQKGHERSHVRQAHERGERWPVREVRDAMRAAHYRPLPSRGPYVNAHRSSRYALFCFPFLYFLSTLCLFIPFVTSSARGSTLIAKFARHSSSGGRGTGAAHGLRPVHHRPSPHAPPGHPLGVSRHQVRPCLRVVICPHSLTSPSLQVGHHAR